MKKVYPLVIGLTITMSLFAQDIHYSQFFNAPLLLNPALTGFTPGPYRVGINYRNQWFTAAGGGFGSSPYMTTAVSGDVPIKVKDDVVGVGLFLANDQAGANTFSTIMACASVSYIKTLGKKKNHHLSAGFQLGVTNTSINSSGFQFASQFQDNIFSSGLSSNENIGKTHVTYPNINAGLLWYGRLTDVVSLYAGGALFNLYQPKYDILTGDNNNLYLRWNVNAGADITINKKYHLLPMLMYMRQGVDNEMNTGLGFGIDFNEDMNFTIGLYNRINTMASGGANGDAIIPYAAFEIKGFKLGLSYDATISQLKSAGSAIGAIELSLTYTGKRKNYNYKSALICPRF
jgi:type IX secretion system PorP/SprF family membrane protein